MNDIFYKDFIAYPNGPTACDSNGLLEEVNERLNNDITLRTRIKVPVKTTFIEELKSETIYEYRYRLTCGDVYRLLGLDESYSSMYDAYFWEFDESGKCVNYFLP